MKNNFKFNVQRLNRCTFLGTLKKNIIINQAATLKNPKSNSIVFAKRLDNETLNLLEKVQDCLLIINSGIELNKKIIDSNEVIVTDNPRLMYAKILDIIITDLSVRRKYTQLQNNVTIGENVIIGENVLIEPFSFIDHDVYIGDNSTIKSGTKIRENVTIGKNCVIGENSIIGGQGFGVEKDYRTGRNIRIPHIGGVTIGDYVEVGALTTIVSGTIEPTILQDYVFIDDLSHIAHNCIIGEGSMVTACTEISGSTQLGSNCFVAPNSTIRNSIIVENNCFIGQATSVTKNIDKNMIVAGNPAEPLEHIKLWRKIRKKLMSDDKG